MDNAAVYEAVRTGTGYRELAAQLGKTQPAVRAMAGRYARANHLASPTVARDLGLKGTVEPAPALKAAEREAPAVVVRPNAPALTDLTYLDPATDQGVFLERLHAPTAAMRPSRTSATFTRRTSTRRRST
jgi:hypothetical protein